MAELKKKILYGVALTLSRFFFPIITYPYVSRVLGPDKLGVLNFSETFSNYFILLAALGIPLYGVREVAKVKDNREELNKVATEITIIHLASTLICLIGFAISVILIDQLKTEYVLNAVFGINIFISFLSLEWVFIGIEKFRFITIRSIITRLVPVFLIFIFVKEKDDYIVFQILNSVAFLLNAALNLWFIRRYITFSSTDLNLKRHINPLVQIFLSSVFIQFYSMIDSLVLGILSGYKSLGVYAAASKLNRILCIVIASLGNVLVPRISNLISSGETQKALAILNKSMKISVGITMPLCAGFFILSNEIIFIVFGDQFADSGLVCRILSPIIVISGISNVFTIQFLLPHARERELMIVYLIGTMLSLLLNIIMISNFDFIGASLAMIATELSILLVSGYYVLRSSSLAIPIGYLLMCTLFCVSFWPIVTLIRSFSNNPWYVVSISTLLCGLAYILFQYIFFRPFLKEELSPLLKQNRD